MNIQILDSWLREHLRTKATPKEIEKFLSLSGPSVEKVEKVGGDYIYDIEITTNRIDMVGVRGIAREAAAILPRHGISAKLKKFQVSNKQISNHKLKFEVKTDKNLTRRVIGVVISDIKNWKSPDWMVKRLEASGIRSLNAPVDITNYVMMEIGHPTHVFDYDLIDTHKFEIRESRKGERIESLEGKEYELLGGDIVIDDGTGKIVDLPGIIGTKNSVVNRDTKNIILFSESNDPVRIRRTSMNLGIRTVAAAINEKSPDPELAEQAILRGVQLFNEVCGAKPVSRIFDTYYNKFKPKKIKIKYDFIANKLGVEIKKSDISKYLKALEFEPKWSGKILTVSVPSFRDNDIDISVDVVEEIARINGYYNLPNNLMDGELPEKYTDIFDFEMRLKRITQLAGGVETYNLSLVSKEEAGDNAVKLANAMGGDTAYMRTSLKPSLLSALKENTGFGSKLHLFEMSNVYEPVKHDLPNETMKLSGIMSNMKYREAKGVVELILNNLNINYVSKEIKNGVKYSAKNKALGKFVKLKDNEYFYDFDVKALHDFSKKYAKYRSIPKYPPQIEDITLVLNEEVRAGDVLREIGNDANILKSELKDVYRDNYTYRLWFYSNNKTLNNDEVNVIRDRVLKNLKKNFGISAKIN